MLPLARELLKRGTAVVLAANEKPAVNGTLSGASCSTLSPASLSLRAEQGWAAQQLVLGTQRAEVRFER